MTPLKFEAASAGLYSLLWTGLPLARICSVWLSNAPRRRGRRWIVLVARGEGELFAHLREAFYRGARRPS
jgi:hypothetical protein